MLIGVLALALLLAGAAIIRTVSGDGATELVAASEADPDDPAGVDPIGPEDLPHAGLLPERTDAMRAAIEAAPVGPGDPGAVAPPGAFSPAQEAGAPRAPDPCAERNRLLPRDLAPVVYRPGTTGCLVSSGVLDDPYLGRAVPYLDSQAEQVGIDRIVPLAYAWRHGASSWTVEQRRAFARDPLNLVAVDARLIRAKATRGPGEWLPPSVSIRCAYAARFAEVATRYGLTISAADQEVARRQCGPTAG